MEKPKKPALRRRETTAAAAMDVKKMSSSLNVSSSSLRSSSSELDHLGRESYGAAPHGAAGRRPAATVRFAPTPTTLSSSSAAAARRAGSSSHVVSSSSSQLQRAGAGVARPATARPASVSGPRARTSAGRSGSLRGGGSPELGPKGLRRSWGWGTGGGGDVEEKASVDHRRPRDDTIAVGEIKSQARSNSVTRKSPTDQEKQQQKRESKTKITSKTMASSVSPPKSAGDVSMERRSPSSTAATRKTTDKAPSSVSHMNNMVRASPPPRKTTLATMGASWESLPPDLQSIGLEVMCYRDAAEVAAVEALQEASSAEILLRCLSAFADLAAVAAEQSPQQTVDEFLALQATLARSSAAARHAEDWLRAAASGDLGHFSLYSASAPAPAAVSRSPPQPATAAGDPDHTSTAEAEEGAKNNTWLGAAAREVGEETRGWFLGHVERLIDADAAGTLGQLKRVNDWLEEAEARAGGMRPSEAVERLRKKIFGYLLDHVESAVVALNGAAVAHGRRK